MCRSNTTSNFVPYQGFLVVGIYYTKIKVVASIYLQLKLSSSFACNVAIISPIYTYYYFEPIGMRVSAVHTCAQNQTGLMTVCVNKLVDSDPG